VVLALAICAILWCDPAFAALVCAHAADCPKHAAPATSVAGKSVASITDAKPCCPMQRHNPARPAELPTCCALSNTGAMVPTASAQNSRASHQLAQLASALFASAALTRYPLPTWHTTVSYVKAVNQKKTDLRI